MIKEVIVVEGKDDIAAVKAAVECEVIATHGYSFGPKLLSTLKKLEKRQGIIIFTDPDYMGNVIRRRLARALDNPKHAFLTQKKATADEDIGIENASPEDIREALLAAKPEKIEIKENFTKSDLLAFGLIGQQDSSQRRQAMGEALGIGYGNGKQFINRLNRFGITKEEFMVAWEALDYDKK